MGDPGDQGGQEGLNGTGYPEGLGGGSLEYTEDSRK